MVIDFTFIHRDWPLGLVMDDLLCYQAIHAVRSQEHRCNTSLVIDDRDLWCLLKMGLEDPRAADHPMDASTCTMRYTAIVGDLIQSSVEVERARVSLIFNHILNTFDLA